MVTRKGENGRWTAIDPASRFSRRPGQPSLFRLAAAKDKWRHDRRGTAVCHLRDDGALDPSSCNSVWGLMLLGGKVRFSHLLSNIGLHQIRPAVEQKLSFTREEVLLYLTVFKESATALSRHLAEMNIDPKLLLYIMQAPDDEMGFLGYSEAKSLGMPYPTL
ncbi:hypothetical protein [Mesorhizobium sp. M0768]|uniref:hypothetical protein n=1 Tax=Mesorhizobium sp. M0768 TaxID=2956996 RepID=UPI0033350ECE